MRLYLNGLYWRAIFSDLFRFIDCRGEARMNSYDTELQFFSKDGEGNLELLITKGDSYEPDGHTSSILLYSWHPPYMTHMTIPKMMTKKNISK